MVVDAQGEGRGGAQGEGQGPQGRLGGSQGGEVGFFHFFIFVYFSAYSESTLEDLTISPCRLYEGHLLRQKS